ncbi:hypothetical protein Tco_0501727 [Tanacetum coccineum]
MDDHNITMEEYIRLEEEKARRRGKVYNWETAMYGKIWYDEDVHDLRSVEIEFPAIIFNDAFTSEEALSCEPTSRKDNDDNEIDIIQSSGGNPHMEVLTEKEIADKFSDKHLMALKSQVNKLRTMETKPLKIWPIVILGPTVGSQSSNITAKKVYESGFYWPSVFKDANEYLNELAELRDGAYENTIIYKERTKKWHDSRLHGDKDFKVGDKVLLYNSRLKMYPGKLKSKWSGPNIVKTVYPIGAIEITDKDGFSFKVNGQRLKKYYGGNIDKEDDEVIELENDATRS